MVDGLRRVVSYTFEDITKPIFRYPTTKRLPVTLSLELKRRNPPYLLSVVWKFLHLFLRVTDQLYVRYPINVSKRLTEPPLNKWKRVGVKKVNILPVLLS